MNVSEVALVLLCYETCDFIVIPKHKYILYEMARWYIYRTLKYQLFSGIIEYLENVMIINLFLLILFCGSILLESA